MGKNNENTIELFVINFDILVSIIGFCFIAWPRWHDRQYFVLCLSGSMQTAQIADHTPHIAELTEKTLEVADKTGEQLHPMIVSPWQSCRNWA